MRRRILIASLSVAIIIGFGFVSEYECSQYCQYFKGGEEHYAVLSIFCDFIGFIGRHIGAISIAFTAVATIVMAIFTIKLSDSTNKMWDASERQLKQSDKSSEAQLRAYISFKDFGGKQVHSKLPGLVDNFLIYPILENGGITYANKAVIGTGWRIVDKPLNADDIFSEPKPDSPCVIGPKCTVNGTGVNISIVRIDKIFAGDEILYMWGFVEYDDVFTGTKRHRTEYCTQVEIQRLGNAVSFVFNYIGPHNTAD